VLYAVLGFGIIAPLILVLAGDLLLKPAGSVDHAAGNEISTGEHAGGHR